MLIGLLPPISGATEACRDRPLNIVPCITARSERVLHQAPWIWIPRRCRRGLEEVLFRFLGMVKFLEEDAPVDNRIIISLSNCSP